MGATTEAVVIAIIRLAGRGSVPRSRKSTGTRRYQVAGQNLKTRQQQESQGDEANGLEPVRHSFTEYLTVWPPLRFDTSRSLGLISVDRVSLRAAAQ